MNILVAYGTYSGSTKLVGELVQQKLSKLGHTVDLLDMRMANVESFDTYDAFVLGTNTWYEKNEEGMMNGAFLNFKDTVTDKSLFKKRPVAVYALGDEIQYLQFCKSAGHLEEMVREFDGTIVTPALRISRYYFDPKSKEAEIDTWILAVAQGFTAPKVTPVV